MLKKVKLSSIKANPYRHFGTYEIQPDKVESLIESIEASGFWGETVIARPVKGGYELAFGHHRWQAAIEVFGEDTMVELSVRDLDNDMMLKMMARENNEVYDANAAQDIELVKAAIEAHAKGEIHMPKGDGNKCLRPEAYCQVTDDRRVDGFSRDALHEYLALDMWRIKEALGHLKMMKAKLTTAKDYAGLSPTQAQEMKAQVNRANTTAGPAVAKKVAKKVSKAIKDKTATRGRGSIGSTKRSAKDVASEVINKETGKNTELHKFVRSIQATRDQINSARLKLRALTKDMVDKGVVHANGPEISDLTKSMGDMEEAIASYRHHFSTTKLKVIK